MTLIQDPHQILNTDLYQLTMAAGYFTEGMANRQASFELYVRRLPNNRSFLLAAGLEQAIDYLSKLSFNAEEIQWLRQLPVFAGISQDFFDYLADFRFSGEVWALAEGTVFFPYEPILRVTAPLIQAQLVETWLLAMLNYQISVASKAARMRLAIESAPTSGRKAAFIDFGSRRAHGPQASLLAARAAWVGGATGTSNVLAGQLLGIPTVGTAAHAWTMAFADEATAFAAYRHSFPGHGTLLVDTYDTLQGVRHAIASGPGLQGIRLDSGDFLELSRESRKLLDQADMSDTRIVVSGDMNEFKIRDLLAAGAPIDLFGVGTELVTSLDAPSLGGVYKLVEVEDGHGGLRRALKLSSSKTSYPGCKQIWRSHTGGTLAGDTLGLNHENGTGTPLLEQVMRDGKLTRPHPELKAVQQHSLTQLAQLPEPLKQLEGKEAYPVALSAGLQNLFETLKREIEHKEMES